MELGLVGKVALVAGGGKGIGRACALALAREGADVAVLARTRTELDDVVTDIQRMGRRALALPTDVQDPHALDLGFQTLTETLGAPTLLVLGVAAYWEPRKLQFESDETLASLIDTDLTASARLAKRALPAMMEARFGRIVALSSLAAQTGVSGGTLYAAAKAGLEGLVRGLALDYGRRGITANAVQLGFVETERLARRLDSLPGRRELLERGTARKSLLRPEEVADVVAFLCSERAGGVTGSVLRVTAGAHLNNMW